MTTTRRDVLTLSTGVAAVAVAAVVLPVPLLNVPGLASAETLTKLAAEGKFLSSRLELPTDWSTTDFAFYLDGVKQTDDALFFKEIYAPGDESGWAVIYNRTEPWDGGTRVVYGRWTVKRL